MKNRSPSRRGVIPRFLGTLERLEQRTVMHGDAPTLTLHTNVGDITMEMLDETAPETVLNFIHYVEEAAYADAIFHRVVPGFVVQGGGFTSASEDLCGCSASEFNTNLVSASQFDSIHADDPVVNEFGRSNVAGTVAMAKLGGNPNSATNQFFFNLADNSSNLDNQNGGFTVFAVVEDMTVVNQIAALPRRNLSSIFPPGSPLRALESVATFADTPQSDIRIVKIIDITGEGTVSGTVFLDSDADGTRDADEGGFTRAEVFVDLNDDGDFDAGEPRTTTDNSGEYFLSLEPGNYVVRPVAFENYNHTDPSAATGHQVTIRAGLGSRGRNIGLAYKGTDWHNPHVATDIDGINGTTPIDALFVINELTERFFSNPTTGALPNANTSAGPFRFLDVTDDQVVAPLDALLVINDLPSTTLRAPLSGSTTEEVPDVQMSSVVMSSIQSVASDKRRQRESALDAIFAEHL